MRSSTLQALLSLTVTVALVPLCSQPSHAIDIQNSVIQTAPFNLERSDPGEEIWMGCPGLWSGYAAAAGATDLLLGRASVGAVAWIEYTTWPCTGAFAEAQENAVLGHGSFVCLHTGVYTVIMQGQHSGVVALHVPRPADFWGGAAGWVRTTFEWVTWDDTTNAPVYTHAEAIDEQSGWINNEIYLLDQDDHWTAQWDLQLQAGHTYSVWIELSSFAHVEANGGSGGAWAVSYFANGGLTVGPWNYPWNGYLQLDSISIEDQNPDLTPPVTTFSPESTMFCDSALVTLTAEDEAAGYGVDRTWYRVNGGAWREYDGPFTIDDEDIALVEYYSVDRAGNAEAPGTRVLHFAHTPAPAVLITPSDQAEVLEGTVVFGWASDPAAENYELQIAASSSFSPPLLQTLTTSTQYEATALPFHTTLYWRVRAASYCGQGAWSDTWSLQMTPTGVEDVAASIPANHYLDQNRPNPFNPVTKISFGLSHDDWVTIDVYAVDGSRVRSLVAASYPAGRYTALWDGTDDRGVGVSSGTYFYHLRTRSFEQTRKMVRLD